MFTEKDLKYIAQKGISKDLVDNQIKMFVEGFPYVNLKAAARLGEGIIAFDSMEVSDYVSFYNQQIKNYDVLKFVPASGAASRMFKDLFELRDALRQGVKLDTILKEDQYAPAQKFINGIKQFAFYNQLSQVLKNDNYDINELIKQGKYDIILDYLLENKGLNYANLPKALLIFHKYDLGNRLAMEEHLVEGANYAVNGQREVKIHFTVSPEHRKIFEKEIYNVLPEYTNQFGASYEIAFSEQKKSTDTIAVDLNNKPFREKDENLLFRPAGHGALIENLNDLDAQIVFIKNIDNVVPDAMRVATNTYKKVIGGHLIKIQQQNFEYLELLDQGDFTEEEFEKIIKFVRETLMIPMGDEFEALASIEKLDFLYSKMNRPMRVCGMVRNEGEPGGGPFWVQDDRGVSLQIVEGSQIDMSNAKQKAIADTASHFNPVDLVCGLRDYKNKAFDLTHYVDPKTGFISQKSKDGRELKAQELPGLWNGAMADWITLFVEVPIETFNPVKTVNDLLRPQHQ